MVLQVKKLVSKKKELIQKLNSFAVRKIQKPVSKETGFLYFVTDHNLFVLSIHKCSLMYRKKFRNRKRIVKKVQTRIQVLLFVIIFTGL